MLILTKLAKLVANSHRTRVGYGDSHGIIIDLNHPHGVSFTSQPYLSWQYYFHLQLRNHSLHIIQGYNYSLPGYLLKR